MLTSEENKELLDHLNYVTGITLGRLFGAKVEGMEWLLSVLPDHYQHRNYMTAARKSLIHVDKPMYYQETKNSDMFKIMWTLQLQYLHLIAEQTEDREKCLEDLKVILNPGIFILKGFVIPILSTEAPPLTIQIVSPVNNCW